MSLRLAPVLLLVAGGLSGCSGAMAIGGGPSVAPSSTGAQLAAVQPSGAAPGAGRLEGGLVAGDIGGGLDQGERQQGLAAEYQALELGNAGTPVAWGNAAAGRSGEVVPGPAYRVNEYACRDYTHTVTVAGQSRSARGTACREPDGTWRPVT